MKLVLMSDTLPDEANFRMSDGGYDDDLELLREWNILCSPRLEFQENEETSYWARAARILNQTSWNLRMSMSMMCRGQVVFYQIRLYRDNMGDGLLKLKQLLSLFGLRITDIIPGTQIRVELRYISVVFKGFVYERHEGMDDGTIGHVYMDGIHDQRPLYYIDLNSLDTFSTILDSLYRTRISFIIDLAKVQTWNGNGVHCCQTIFDRMFASDYGLISNEGEQMRCHKILVSELSPSFRSQIENSPNNTRFDLSTAGLKAFLRFLYCSTLDGCNNQTFIELFQFANSNGLANLGASMGNEIRRKDAGWFDARTVFALFLIAHRAHLGDIQDRVCGRLVRLALSKRIDVSDHPDYYHQHYFRDQSFFRSWCYYLSEQNLQDLTSPDTDVE